MDSCVRKYFLALLLLAPVYLAACSDDSSTGDDGEQSFEVGSEGGTVSYRNPDNENVLVQLEIPAGSVDDGTTITMKPADSADYPADDDIAPFTAFEFGPSGLTFDPPATLTISYDEDELGGLEESELLIHKVVDGEWSALASIVDTDANTVSAGIGSFSFWAIIRAIVQAFIAPSVESVTPDGTGCASADIGTAMSIVIVFDETMDTGSLALGGMLGSGGSREEEDDGGAWSTTTVTNDTLTISPLATWAAGSFTFTVDADDTDGNPISQLSLCYNAAGGGGTPE